MTLKQIAKLANVSVSTASRAINNSYDISDETRELVLRIAEENGYFQDKKRVKIENRKKSNYNIAILCPEIVSVYYAGRVQDLLDEFEKRLCNCIVYNTNFSNAELIKYINKCMKDNDTNAIISFINVDFDLKNVPIPIVVFGESKNYSYIHTDIQSGINQAVLHLKKMGVKRIAFAGEIYTEIRQECFLCACSQYELKDADAFVANGRFDNAGIMAANYFLQAKEMPEGIVCAYDEIAYGLIDTLTNAGVRVPDDVYVVGINNIPSSKYVFGGLTTVHFEFTKVCKAIVEDIINDLNDQTIRRHVYVSTARLIKRNT